MKPHVACTAGVSKPADASADHEPEINVTSLMQPAEPIVHVTLPAGYLPFFLAGIQTGWLKPQAAKVLLQHGCAPHAGGANLPNPQHLPSLAQSLATPGRFPFRGEAFDVRAEPDGPILSTIDRGALPWFGIRAEGVHVNGLVRRADGIHLWIARRAANRPIDPGKLDHLFAGGIAAGSTPAETLIKEGAEEAGLPPEIVRRATPAGTISYTVARREGLRRDRLHCYDLWLPEDVTPVPTDGEVAAFELWPIERVVQTLRGTNDFKFNVGMVIGELIERLGRQALLF
jgi:8-oxo-dGTP pyrophosphatase MutT (NUDIX family)